MVFWFLAMLTVAGIGVGVKFDCGDVGIVGTLVGIISGIFTVILLIMIISANATAGGDRASMEQRYEALIYKAHTEAIRDEFGIVNKEFVDEVQAWNEELAKYQAYSHDFWIGVFYPQRVYDGLEFIKLENIKMKED